MYMSPVYRIVRPPCQVAHLGLKTRATRLRRPRKDALGIMKDVVRIHSSLNALQLGKMFAPVSALGLLLAQLGVGVVDILTPVRQSHARGDVTDEVLHRAATVGWVPASQIDSVIERVPSVGHY